MCYHLQLEWNIMSTWSRIILDFMTLTFWLVTNVRTTLPIYQISLGHAMVPYLGVHIRYHWGTQWSTVHKAVWILIYPNRAINSKCMWVAIRLKQKETTPDIDVKIQKLRLKIEMAGAVMSAVFTFGIAGWPRGFHGRNSSAVSVSAHCTCKYISISKVT